MAEEEIGGDGVRYTTKELLKDIRDDLAGVRQDSRDRFHKLVGTIDGINLRLVQVEEDVRYLKRDRDILVPAVEALEKNSDIKGAVDAAFENQKDKGFTKREKLIGLSLAVIVALMNVLAALHGMHVI